MMEALIQVVVVSACLIVGVTAFLFVALIW